MKTDAELCGGDSFSRMVFGTMGFKTSVNEQVSTTVMTTLGGFETARVGRKEIGTLFLETSATLNVFGLATVTSLVVVGFKAVGTHGTGPEKPRKTGDDIIVIFFVQ